MAGTLADILGLGFRSLFLHIIIHYRPSFVAVFFVSLGLIGLQVLRVAQVKTEHRKGEPSKTTCREICR